MKRGFSILEILIVLFIIAVLLVVSLPFIQKSREKGWHDRALGELRSMETGVVLYFQENGEFPPDVSRNVPPGIEDFINPSDADNWPSAPWPGSVYDWENWDDPDNPGEKIYQISIRFCPIGGPLSACKFPNQPWAANFNVNSSFYYCIQGACRSHESEPLNYPGYCVNCATQPSG